MTIQRHSIVPRSCLITSSGAEGPGPMGGKPAMHNGIEGLPEGTFTLHVPGVFVNGRTAHVHYHPMRVSSNV